MSNFNFKVPKPLLNSSKPLHFRNQPCVVARVNDSDGALIWCRNLGFVFLSLDLTGADKLRVGHWVDADVEKDIANPVAHIGCWWRVLRFRTIPEKFELALVGTLGHKTELRQVEALVSTFYPGYFGYLWNEELGRIFIHGRLLRGFQQEQQLKSGFLLHCSVTPLIDNRQYTDVGFQVVSIEKLSSQPAPFPSSVRQIRGTISKVFVGHAILFSPSFGEIFMSFNDYHRKVQELKSILAVDSSVEYEMMVVPTQAGHPYKHRAIYVSPLVPEVFSDTDSSTKRKKKAKKQSKASEEEVPHIQPISIDKSQVFQDLKRCTGGTNKGTRSVSTSSPIQQEEDFSWLDEVDWNSGSEEETAPSASANSPRPAPVSLVHPIKKDASCQTDPMVERRLIDVIINDREIFKAVSTRHSNVIYEILNNIKSDFLK